MRYSIWPKIEKNVGFSSYLSRHCWTRVSYMLTRLKMFVRYYFIHKKNVLLKLQGKTLILQRYDWNEFSVGYVCILQPGLNVPTPLNAPPYRNLLVWICQCQAKSIWTNLAIITRTSIEYLRFKRIHATTLNNLLPTLLNQNCVGLDMSMPLAI